MYCAIGIAAPGSRAELSFKRFFTFLRFPYLPLTLLFFPFSLCFFRFSFFFRDPFRFNALPGNFIHDRACFPDRVHLPV
jgi:hypothetical protein